MSNDDSTALDKTRPPVSGEAFTRRATTIMTAAIVIMTFGFSLGNVTQLCINLGITPWIAWLVGPAVDLSVVGLLAGIRFLSLHGYDDEQLRKPRRLLRFCGDLGLAVARMVVALLVPAGESVLASVDDTLFKRRGKKVWAASWFHDGSAPGWHKTGHGNNWVVLAIPPPGTGARGSHPPPTWPPSSDASSSPPHLSYLILTSRHAKKSTPSA